MKLHTHVDLPSACSNSSFLTHVYQLKTLQDKVKQELAKPGKDGLGKTREECVDEFSKVFNDVGIAKNTFLRNDGFAASLSKSKPMSFNVHVLEENLQAERATADALRVDIERLSTKLERRELKLEQTRQNHEKLMKVINMPAMQIYLATNTESDT